MKRKVMFLIIVFSVLFICTIQSYSQDYNIIQQVKDYTNGGYSIFDKTMVDMSWPDIEKSINDNTIVLFPIAVIEEHGPHMNCGSDIYQIYFVTKLIKHQLEDKGFDVLITPPVYWGIADIGRQFPGNFTVSEMTFRLLLTDILLSLESWGVKNVIAFNGHGEPKHGEIIEEVLDKANTHTNLKAYVCVDEKRINSYHNKPLENYVIPVKYKKLLEIDCRYDNHHADCYETGTMAGLFPEFVDTILARKLEPTNFRESDKYRSPWEVGEAWFKNAREVTPLGYFGDPASFDVKKSVYNLYQEVTSQAEAIEKFFISKQNNSNNVVPKKGLNITAQNNIKLAIPNKPNPEPGKQVCISENLTGDVIDNYWIYLPRGYDKTKKWPVILFLQGGLGVSSDSTTVKDAGPAHCVLIENSNKEFDSYLKDTFIIINPHMRLGNYWERQWYQQYQSINSILNYVIDSYSGDSTRIYLTGLSRGGHGTWGLGQILNNRFAAIVPISGDTHGVTDYSCFQDFPVWIAHCTGDDKVNYKKSIDAVNTINKISDTQFLLLETASPKTNDFLEAKHIFTTFNKDSHDAWTETYDKIQIYQWMLKQIKE